MNLAELFNRVLNADYIQLKENAASYATKLTDETLWIYFEKSNGATDWKNNLDFPAKPYHKMPCSWYVHRGFLRVFRTIEPHIRPLILNEKVTKIIIAGYSHGAALALLCHEYCVFNRHDLKDKIYGYGFGCPRVVWGPICREVEARFFNFLVIRNSSDIVTHLPPKLLGFRHVGKILHIGRGARYGFIQSHEPQNYIKELAKNG